MRRLSRIRQQCNYVVHGWNEIQHSKHFYLVDSYEGLDPSILTVEELALGAETKYGSNYANTYSRALQNLSEFKNTEPIKGFVPQALTQVKCDRVAYLHIDMKITMIAKRGDGRPRMAALFDLALAV
jgi:hypothetical protein